MSVDQIMEKPGSRIKRISETLIKFADDIYEEGGIPISIWDTLLHESLLGRIAPNAAVGRAVLNQIRQLDDELLTSIILHSIEQFKPKDRNIAGPIKAWLSTLHDELLTKTPPNEHELSHQSEQLNATVANKAKIDFKLKTYDGTSNGCAVWFWELEKALQKLRVHKTDFVLHAINASLDKARTTICLLDDEMHSDYDMIKKSMISIFDTKSNQEVLREYGRNFRQNNTESATDFYIRFKLKVAELLAKGIWQEEQLHENFLIHQFRSKIRMILEEKVSEYIEDKEILEHTLTLEQFFHIVVRVDQRMSSKVSQTESISVPIVPDHARRIRCNYCEQF
jgi:hypothetical protein